MEETYYVYMVRCSDGTLYTGTARDVEARVATHNRGQGAKYTRARRPVELVYREKCPDKSTALKREYQLKQLPRAKKLVLIGSKTLPSA